MKLPSREYVVAGKLVCASAEQQLRNWQAHVVKHPLGVDALASTAGRERWNREGWDAMAPPVVTDAERAEIVEAIAALSDGDKRCEIPEFRGKKGRFSDLRALGCYECAPKVFTACAKILGAPVGVGVRYAQVTEELLAAVADGEGVAVPWARFFAAVQALWRTPEKLSGAVVLTVGLDDRRGALPIARISRHDGVRAEFFLEEPSRLRWRTTHRSVQRLLTGPLLINFLGQNARPAPRLGAVSELCVVARRWWESHGR